MTSDTIFTIAWVSVLVWFIVWETWALIRRRRGDTLSEHVWDWFCLRGKKQGKSAWCIIRRVAFYSFWIWLTVHFLSGGAIL